MKKKIDCLIVGHNQIKYDEFIDLIERIGKDTSTYRDLNMNFLTHKSRKYNATDIYNDFCVKPNQSLEHINYIETFSTTISYLVTYLNKRGFTYEYIHSFQEEKDNLIELLQTCEINAIAISTTLYVISTPLFEVLDVVKKYNKGSKIIIGGHFIATQMRISSIEEQKNLFNKLDADYYVNSSQGEKALVDLLSMIKNTDKDIGSIDNVIYKSNGEYIFNKTSEENNKLQDNLVNWDLVSNNVGNFINIRTSISCPFKCSFCGFPEHAGKYQAIKTCDIEKELNTLKNIDGIKNIFFLDDTFNVPPKRFKEILNMMIKRKDKFNWHSFIRSQYIDKEIASMMKESGCESVFLGIESGSDTILKNMNKQVTAKQYLKGIEILSDAGIQTYGSFIIGFPGETEKTFQETYNFIKNSALDFYRAQLWYYEFITPIWREREKYNIQGKGFEWSHSTLNSEKACDMIEKLIIEVNDPIRVPQYYFDYEFLVQLQYKGMTKQQLKTFLIAFNEGVREKILNKNISEASDEIIEMISKLELIDKKNHSEVNWELGIPELDF